ncbi:hypothetical protein QA640_15075 [Bradyrhizobium sp. CB82]|uniref:hypothetical protein n=1 Tax=Bradyrhizobium sp. CB82 TaxID=3039159 RepID=UPI0024B232EE|nr:hypothetical protein [Bradyrhizobium sp. CB82]WFU43635.1 hypothetical protein QA640_15075 [Bradyrhizobium sp. CB82]
MTNWQSDLDAFIAETKAFVERVGAKRRLADEYDAAQERGELRSNGERSFSSPEKVSGPELVPPKELHEARITRDAEAAEPGIVQRALDEKLVLGEEPTKASRRQIVADPNRPREEILQRVANFRAHQERFMREREDFAAAELRRMWGRANIWLQKDLQGFAMGCAGALFPLVAARTTACARQPGALRCFWSREISQCAS